MGAQSRETEDSVSRLAHLFSACPKAPFGCRAHAWLTDEGHCAHCGATDPYFAGSLLDGVEHPAFPTGEA